MSEHPDDLLPLLTPPRGSAPDAAPLLAATTGLLRRRARVRRASMGVGVLLVFALGGAAGWVLKPTPEREFVTVTETVYVPAPAPAPAPPADSPPSPAALELLAEQADTPAEMARLYRAAGNGYLIDGGDYEQALRCYRLYFRHGGADARTVSADDSWLLITLKTSKLKENRDANPGI